MRMRKTKASLFPKTVSGVRICVSWADIETAEPNAIAAKTSSAHNDGRQNTGVDLQTDAIWEISISCRDGTAVDYSIASPAANDRNQVSKFQGEVPASLMVNFETLKP